MDEKANRKIRGVILARKGREIPRAEFDRLAVSFRTPINICFTCEEGIQKHDELVAGHNLGHPEDIKPLWRYMSFVVSNEGVLLFDDFDDREESSLGESSSNSVVELFPQTQPAFA